MDYKDVVDNLDEQTINKLRTAVELGRWENGDKLTEAQRDNAMQAVMMWQANKIEDLTEEPFKVNNKGEFKIGKGATLDETPLEFRQEIDKQILDKRIIFKSKG